MLQPITRTLVLLSMLSLIACGNKQADPTAKYPEVKDAVAVHNVQPQQQQVIPPYLIQVIPDSDINFVEDKPATFSVRVYVHAQVTFTVRAENLPAGAAFEKHIDPNKANTWTLSWKPGSDFIDPGEYDRGEQFNIRIIPSETSSKVIQNHLARANLVKSIDYRVRRSKAAPILTAQKLKENINEGRAFDFIVKVDGEGLGVTNPPQVTMIPTKRLYEANGSSFVYLIDRPKKDKNGVWHFIYRFDTRTTSVPDQLFLTGSQAGKRNNKASSVNTVFSIKAHNPSTGVSSPEKVVKVKINFQPKKPIFTFQQNDQKITLTSGQANVVQFAAFSPDQRGQVQVAAETLTALEALGSGAAVNCGEAGAVQSCQITVTPKCQAKSSAKRITFVATNTTEVDGEKKPRQAKQKVSKAVQVLGNNCKADGGSK